MFHGGDGLLLCTMAQISNDVGVLEHKNSHNK
jgi:hypothetical protein